MDQIAIVYAHEEEKKYYMELLNYFTSQGYLNNDLKDFELNDLQGVLGLRSLRISINMAMAINLNENEETQKILENENKAA